MKITKTQKQVIAIGAAAILIYLVYRWYQNQQGNSAAGGITLGTNLGSSYPSLSAGATGPSSGLTGATSETILNISAPLTQSSTSSQSSPSTTPQTPPVTNPHSWHPWPWFTHQGRAGTMQPFLTGSSTSSTSGGKLSGK